MEIKKVVLSGAICIAIALSIGYAIEKSPSHKENYGVGGDDSAITVQFYDEKKFYDSLAWIKNNPRDLPSCDVSGVVIPHHDSAGFMAGRLFSKLAEQEIETIIIIGPNHWERGGKIITSDSVWGTSFGALSPGSDVITDLELSGVARLENGIMEKEHSTTGLFPMLAYYLPEARVVPIILSAKNKQEDIEKLSVKLASYLQNEKTILVASTDFSHYLNQEMAEKRDVETIHLIEGGNIEKIMTLGNDNLDSPGSIAALLLAMQKTRSGEVQIIEHMNSADILGGNIAKTTSYFSLVFCRE